MAQHYRNIIVQVLKEYDNTLTEEVYQALAWEGLRGTVAWNLLSLEEKTNIDQISSNYEDSTQNCE